MAVTRTPGKCPICKGEPVQRLFFSHPECSADGDLVVEATCTRCKPRKEKPDPDDVVNGFHHVLIGKVKMRMNEMTPEKKSWIPEGWTAVKAVEPGRMLVIRPYEGVKQNRYTAILRKAGWNHLTPNYIYPQEGGYCPVKKDKNST